MKWKQQKNTSFHIKDTWVEETVTKAIIRIRRWGFIGFDYLDSPTEDLVFQFKIYSGYGSKRFATIVMFLAGGIKSMI